MRLTQNWVGYLDRSYQQIKNKLLTRLSINNPEVTDHTDSNILVVIISMFAGVAEMLNYYIDSISKESFLGTAQKYTSVVRLSKLIDYNIKAATYSTVDLLFTLIDSNTKEVVLATNAVSIPKGTLVSDSNGLVFRTLIDQIILSGQSSSFTTAGQFEETIGETLGSTNGTTNQKLALPPNYVDGSIKLFVDGDQWDLYNSQGLMFANTKGFIVTTEEDGVAYVQFGDDVNGAIPTAGQTITIDYLTTAGAEGNLPPNSIQQIVSTIVLPTGVELKVNNPDYAAGGSNFETTNEIRDRAPRSLRTLNRAVTYQDYKDVAMQVPEVGSAEVSYCCGKYIDLYVVPKTKGNATLALMSKVQDYIDCKKMITTQVQVRPSGVTRIWLKGKLYAKPLITPDQLFQEVIKNLDLEYGFNKVQINRRIAISDIIRVIENSKGLDIVELEEVRLSPFVRPLETNENPLNIIFVNLPKSTIRARYTIQYKLATSKFQIYKDNYLQSEIILGETYVDNNIQFNIGSGFYENNNKWEFIINPSYPEIFPTSFIDVTDYTAPIIDVSPDLGDGSPRTIYSNLEVITQGVRSNCLPPC